MVTETDRLQLNTTMNVNSPTEFKKTNSKKIQDRRIYIQSRVVVNSVKKF